MQQTAVLNQGSGILAKLLLGGRVTEDGAKLRRETSGGRAMIVRTGPEGKKASLKRLEARRGATRPTEKGKRAGKSSY